MTTRRTFIKNSSSIALGSMLLPSIVAGKKEIKNPGIQLYTVRKEMLDNPVKTLEQLAALGIKQIESAGSEKGHYYGLAPKEMKKVCSNNGMTLRSGHIGLDDKWKQTLDEAAESGQEYLICSSMPLNGQTVSNYKKVADMFNKAGEDAKKLNIKFGYHNHEYEFEKDNNTVLYDVLMDNTDPALVHMELDLGWVVASGNDPMAYFTKYPGRFPLWHLKDMDLVKKHSTEFGKGGLNIKKMLDNTSKSGLKYFFIEQEEYTGTPLESVKYNMDYLKKL